MNVAQRHRELKRRLSQITDEAGRESSIIMCRALSCDSARLFMRGEERLTREQERMIDDMLARRISREPLQYILGEWEFMGLAIKCDSRALIPRKDTELIAERAMELIIKHDLSTALDMCAGSGCIGIAMAATGKLARVDFADISAPALSLARENAQMHGVRGEFIETDLFEGISGRYDMITINPPYLSREDMGSIAPELSREPRSALFGGEDGLDFYRRIRDSVWEHVDSGGYVVMEIGATQADAVREIFGGGDVIRDFGGNDRGVVLKQGAQANSPNPLVNSQRL